MIVSSILGLLSVEIFTGKMPFLIFMNAIYWLSFSRNCQSLNSFFKIVKVSLGGSWDTRVEGNRGGRAWAHKGIRASGARVQGQGDMGVGGFKGTVGGRVWGEESMRLQRQEDWSALGCEGIKEGHKVQGCKGRSLQVHMDVMAQRWEVWEHEAHGHTGARAGGCKCTSV